ncbi:Bcr/CflA family multidrug efflux MFS transporter [Vibrio sp. SS-MA-C1-2]|uniref:purine nucleoside transporter PunC n=1 Tax=Vibrio sp. SS-MA-C1-2 TaxID=2908646 RepID=UPI001F208C0B|nr:purine nucleoside transporter PunC [Vibrio sp. SS-MA-C1-2]UJF19999.1 Bcr/CflA family multidrug efflux MFS transporter [Vibrio sp. SS-MA-C1-2]
MRVAINTFTFIWFAGLSMLGFIATDMYLPAFHSMQQSLMTDKSMIGWTMSIFLLGMALGQLVYGPLSDRIGRKKALIFGLTLFAITSFVCATTESIYVLLTMRFFQALGACSAAVIWQAVVIDRYDSIQSQRIFATIMPLVALSPALAPLLGSFLDAHLGWRSIFYTLIGLGALLALATAFQPESLQKKAISQSWFKQLKQDYREIFSSSNFKGNMLIYAGCSAAFFAWLTGSPFVMSAMGYSGADIGLSYIPQTIAFIIGGYGCRSLLNKIEGPKLLPWLLLVLAVSILSMVAIALTQPTTIVLVLIPFCVMAACNGAIYPIVVNQALSEFKHCSATAAGLLNVLQTLLSFAASALVSSLANTGLIGVTFVMAGQLLFITFGFSLFKKGRKQAAIA